MKILSVIAGICQDVLDYPKGNLGIVMLLS